MASLAGDSSRPLRIQLMNEQRAVQCDQALAEALESASTFIEHNPDDQFITQGAYDDDVFFILRGSATIETNGHRHVIRKNGCHVGEMALLEPGAGRSANVYAGENGAVLLRVSGDDIRKIGNQYPSLWRNFARELSERLRGRDSLFIQPNAIPAVFIASSGAARPDLDQVVNRLTDQKRVVKPWIDASIFMPSNYTLNSLIAQASCVDFAVIIATPDDLIQKNVGTSRLFGGPKKQKAARDNVLLEFGLFVGALERSRVVVLEKKGVGLPTDMQGLTTLRYADNNELDSCIDRIADCVDRLGPLQRLKRRDC